MLVRLWGYIMKKCPNCKSEISRYQEYCYQCGQEIKRTSKRPKHMTDMNWLFFFIGLVLPPVGFLLYFIFGGGDQRGRSAIIGAIVTFSISFTIGTIMGLFSRGDTESEMIFRTFLLH